MSLLDSQGRIMGKVNLVDALIIIFILLIIVGGAVQVARGIELFQRSELVDVVVRVEARAVKAGLVGYLEPGRAIRPARATEDGEILSVAQADPENLYIFRNSFFEPLDPEKYRKVTLEFKAIGEIFSNSYFLYGERVYLGEDLALEAGKIRFSGTIQEIKPLE